MGILDTLRSFSRTVSCCVLGITFAGGCSSLPRHEPVAAPPGLVVVQSRPASDGLIATELYGPNEREWKYTVLDEDGQPTGSVTISRRSSSRFSSQWVDEEEGRQSQFWRVDENGAVMMTATIDYEEDALSQFAPPLVIAPEHLTPSRTFEATSRMRVMESSNPRKERESGTATRRLTLMAQETIRTPIGEVDALRLEVEFIADLKLADAVQHDVLWVSREHGIVAVHSRKTVRILGGFDDTATRTLVIAAPPQ